MTNLIGISGKINSGKDTIGKIIQMLTSPNYRDEYFYKIGIDNNRLSEYNFSDSDWQVRKFADKLKDIVCLLIGCTREQLESQEFKSSPLGKEWERWYWSYYKMTSSHNTKGKVSGYFVSEKEALEYKKNLDKDYVSIARELKSEILTPRLILQELGTQGLRDLIHPNSHINALFTDYKSTIFTESFYNEKANNYTGITNKSISKFPNWIITDVRFPNEIEAIKERNGIVIRVNRNTESTSNHESEIALDNYTDFDYIIDNNGSIEDLIKQVERILKAEFIL